MLVPTPSPDLTPRQPLSSAFDIITFHKPFPYPYSGLGIPPHKYTLAYRSWVIFLEWGWGLVKKILQNWSRFRGGPGNYYVSKLSQNSVWFSWPFEAILTRTSLGKDVSERISYWMMSYLHLSEKYSLSESKEAMIKTQTRAHAHTHTQCARCYIKRVRDSHYQLKNLTIYYVPSTPVYSSLLFRRSCPRWM